jgi:hypothetical protein
MKWTNKKPDRPGWWWYRFLDTKACVCVSVYAVGRLKRMYAVTALGVAPIKDVPGQWSDQPIPEPEG